MIESDLQIPDALREALTKPVAVLGDGVSGKSVRTLCQQLGVEVTLFDERSQGEGVVAVFDETVASEFGLVVYSPGFPMGHTWLAQAEKSGALVLPEFDFASLFWKGPIIAITGTNGKTTLTEFLAKAFSHAGVEANPVGNIGQTLTELIAKGVNRESIAVSEVSSFQAEALRFMTPDFVLWTNFSEDHLDRHVDMKEYFDAKYRLVCRCAPERVRFGRSVLRAAREYDIDLPESGVVVDEGNPKEIGIGGTIFATLPERKTFLMAQAFWEAAGFNETELIATAHDFKKSPHRMELISTVDGVSFWDDSKATNYHAVFGAMARFEDQVIWIGGGKAKGGDLERFIDRLAPRIREAHLIGETKAEIGEFLEKHKVSAVLHETMEDAVLAAFKKSRKGDNVLLSPGFASFDMFEGYSHRGETFKDAVNLLNS